MMKMLLVLTISCFFFFFFGSHSLNSSLVPSSHFKSPSCPPHQRNTLLLFKLEFQIQEGCSSPKTETWNEHIKDCCSWDGVICDPKSGLVNELNLYQSCLLGRFSSNSSLFMLLHLQRLDLSFNNFSLSPIPSEFSRLTKLTHLDLSNSEFSGQVPPQLFHLTKLVSLCLGSDYFPHGLSSEKLEWNDVLVRNLSSLQELDFQNIIISSDLPDAIGDLKYLTYLKLQGCNLSGPIPTSFGKLSKLTTLFLRDNKLNGYFPLALLNLTQLSFLNLSYNELTGKLPSNMSKLSKLEIFYASSNFLSGTLPSSLFMIPSLKIVYLSENQLVGPLNFQLTLVDLSFNSFSSFESPYRFQTSIIFLKASNNNITGKVSESICHLSNLKILDLSNNHFSGPIPQCLWKLKYLSVLSLQKNNLSGILPRLCNNDSNLTTIDIGHNRLEGKLSRSLERCGKLEFFNARRNQINDTFPFWMTSLTNLQVLMLSSNSFHGPIWLPDNSFGFSKLRIIDVSYNAFTGNLPSTDFNNWTAISSILVQNDSSLEYMEPALENFAYVKVSYQESINLMYKGNERELEKIPTILTAIDYSNNKLKGRIPESVGELKALNLINLAGNAFTGQIPRSLINLNNLEALDFSRNRLSGEIPKDLGKLTSLAVINLSYNEFTGGIPQSPQFQTQSPWSYVGNPGLCGLPLPKCYTPHETVEAMDHSKEEEEEVISWIAAAIAFGPAFVVAAIITHIGAYKKRWWVRTNSGGDRRTIVR